MQVIQDQSSYPRSLAKPNDNSGHVGQVLLPSPPPGHRPSTLVLSLLGLTGMYRVYNYTVQCHLSYKGGQKMCWESVWSGCEEPAVSAYWDNDAKRLKTLATAQARNVRPVPRQHMVKCLMYGMGS